jgi:hypothetical protein
MEIQNSISEVERAKEKARKLVNSYVGIYQTMSILTGKLKSVSLERLWSMKVLFCRLHMENVTKFDLEGKVISRSDEEIVYVSKPEFVLSLEELEKANSKVYKKLKEMLA